MATLLSFYCDLPKEVPGFYVKGYTEALSLYTGVRVVPSDDWIPSLDPQYLRQLNALPAPYYFVPVVDGECCYGFVCKGMKRMTPHLVTSYRLPGWELVDGSSVVYLVEGFKDTYLLRYAGLSVLPLLGSQPSSRLLVALRDKGCSVVYVPDNDCHRQSFVDGFCRRVAKSAPDLRYVVYMLSRVKDLGDYFDSDFKCSAIRECLELKSLSGGF